MTASVTFDIIGRDKASSALSKVGSEAERSSTMLGHFGRTAAAVFTGTALYAGARDLIRLGEGIGQLGSTYVTTLNQVQAISRTSNTQISANAAALEAQSGQYAKMGQTAGDAASGELELTKAGLSLKSAYAAIIPTMTLAKSGQLAVGDAATLVSNTLNAYHLKAKQAVDITNDIANAADISSADVTDLAESFKYVSPLAAKSGVDLAETNAVLAELANNGVKASQAGTSFRKFLLSIQAPSKAGATALQDLGVQVYDNQGKMRSLTDIVGQFQDGLDGLSEENQNADLKAIFGLTGLTGATILLKGGTEGLAKYTKGVGQAGGASRLAEANSKGLAGTLSMLRAELETDAESLYRKYSPAVNDVLIGLIGKAKDALPKFEAVAKSAFNEVAPTVESLGRLAVTLGGDFKDLASGGGTSELISALKVLNGLAKDSADFLNGLPAPVRQIGIEIGIAALLFPTFAGGVGSVTGSIRTQIATIAEWRASMALVPPEIEALYADLGMTSARTTATSAAVAKFSSAAKTAAGVGGMAALIASSHQSNDALSTLESTAGAAAVGFSVGGPWGAAIGGAAGLLFNLGKKLQGTQTDAEKMYLQLGTTGMIKKAVSSLDDLKSTLDQVSGAYTEATRAAVLKKLNDDGLTSTAASLGISQRQLINLALGQKGAMAALTPIVDSYKGQMAGLDAQIKAVESSSSSYYTVQDRNGIKTKQLTQTAFDQINSMKGQKAQLQGNLAELQKMPGALNADAKAIQQNAAATADYTGKLKGIPPIVRSQIEADGLLPTTKAIANLSQEYALTPKQVKTLIAATGADTSAAAVQRLIDKINALHDKYVTVHYNYVGLQGSGGSGPTRGHDAGSSGRAAAGGYAGTPLSLTLRGLGANPDGSPDTGKQTQISHAAEQLLTSIVKGIDKGKKPLDNVLSQVDASLKNHISHYKSVLSQYQALQSGFAGFEPSIFSTQGSTDDQGNQLPASLAQILAQSGAGAAGATSLNADVQKLIGEGLSKALIQQMEDQGASGVSNIHTLATQASLSDIAQLNSDQSTTTAQLGAAGTAVADAIDGSDLKAAKRADDQLKALKDILKALQEGQQTVLIQLDGQTIDTSVKHHKKHHPDS